MVLVGSHGQNLNLNHSNKPKKKREGGGGEEEGGVGGFGNT